MILLATALYCEAKPFIDVFSLKKDSSINKFQVFKNDDIILVVTGTGCINMACACTYLISAFEVSKYDTFINIGICGSLDENISIGTTILCNKIINNSSKREFYPDMIIKHPFKEGSIESFSKIVEKADSKYIQGDIVDMEAAGFFEAVSIFMPPHRIFTLKIVSDHLDSKNLNRDDVEKLIQQNSHNIVRWILNIKDNSIKPKGILSEKDMDYINEIVDNLKLSAYMQNKLKKLSGIYKLRNDNLTLALEPFTQIYCKSKHEGKMYFEGLVKQLEFF
jgi:nucleoside phosphorylase